MDKTLHKFLHFIESHFGNEGIAISVFSRFFFKSLELLNTFIKIDDPLIKFLYCTISQDPRTLKEKNHHG